MESTLSSGAGDAGLKLIETLAWDGAVLVRLALHIARLSASAARLGWDCDPGRAEAALRAAVTQTPARLRLTLDADGQIEVQSQAMPAPAEVWRVGVASQQLLSTDIWLQIKSTRRASYDAARAAMALGLDELILLNERGEVCDGSITTVFFDRGEGMRTPPLSCGLLPGVLRAELCLQEEVLRREDLPRVQLWVGNSLRGLMRAVFVP